MLHRIIGLVLVAIAVSATASAQDHLKPGETFRDCPDCPEMVVIPAGSFMMGSPASEPERPAVGARGRDLDLARRKNRCGESF